MGIKMAILKIITKEDELLYKKSRPVEEITPRIIRLLDDMKDTLHQANGAGLAAVQVGVLRRVVLVETEPGELIELINPELVSVSEEIQDGVEGCLSVPGEWGMVKRPMKATVRAQDRNGNWFEITGEGLKARCFCHELEHLDGNIYTQKAYKMLSPEEIENI